MKIKWNKVTWYSKAMALVMFVILPFYGFWLGTLYGGTKQYAQDMIAELKNASALPIPMATKVINYLPSPPASMTPVSGTCFASSIAAPYRDDAWRCSIGNAIQDPCFQIPGSANLLCDINPENPSSSATTVLSLVQPLPAAAGHSSAATPADGAWLVKLKGGILCSPFTGTLPFSDKGDVATYGCTDKRLVFGINTAGKIWIAKVGMLGTAKDNSPPPLIDAATVPVAAVWK